MHFGDVPAGVINLVVFLACLGSAVGLIAAGVIKPPEHTTYWLLGLAAVAGGTSLPKASDVLSKMLPSGDSK